MSGGEDCGGEDAVGGEDVEMVGDGHVGVAGGGGEAGTSGTPVRLGECGVITALRYGCVSCSSPSVTSLCECSLGCPRVAASSVPDLPPSLYARSFGLPSRGRIECLVAASNPRNPSACFLYLASSDPLLGAEMWMRSSTAGFMVGPHLDLSWRMPTEAA